MAKTNSDISITGDIGIDLKKISEILENLMLLIKEDRDRAIAHYDDLKEQLNTILEFQSMSDEGAIEKEITKTLSVITEASNKPIKNILDTISKILTTQIQGETIKSMGGGNFGGNRKSMGGLNITKLLQDDEITIEKNSAFNEEI